ncbi:helix-turn-helix domain-containing protein [Actinoalloteichus caeruleus]|uniref:helix-turn-helix domain-containing protein n=1 Tax=Actinoalloteichus cyanogriseus TaxID=2893586 RepID=UPI003BB90277
MTTASGALGLRPALHHLIRLHPGDEVTAGPLAAPLEKPTTAIDHELELMAAEGLLTPLPHASGPTRFRRDGANHTAPLGWAWLLDMLDWYLRRTAEVDRALDPYGIRSSPVYDRANRRTGWSPDRALLWLAAERTNVLAAQSLASLHGWDELTVSFAESLGIPLLRGGYLDDLGVTHHLALAARPPIDPLLLATLHLRLAEAHLAAQDHSCAIAECVLAQDIAAGVGGGGHVRDAARVLRAQAEDALGQRAGAPPPKLEHQPARDFPARTPTPATEQQHPDAAGRTPERPARRTGSTTRDLQRAILAAKLAARYHQGHSIQELATSIGRSYDMTRRLLREAGVRLRPGGRRTARTAAVEGQER